MADRLRVAVVARSVFPLHGVGGLERHVFDLLRHHLADGITVTLVTREPPAALADAAPPGEWTSVVEHPSFTLQTVPYRSFPLAGRRGTTIIDRSTAYPRFGRRAGQVADHLAREGLVDIVYALGASGYGYALARGRGGGTAPFVLNPQGLEEFGGADGGYGGQPLKRIGYAPLRRVVRATAAAADAVIATDRALEPVVMRQLGVEPARLRLVPNGIDIEGCDRLASGEDGRRRRQVERIGEGDVVLLSVGRLEQNKGFHYLARALARWRDRPGWCWVIAGQGPFRAGLEDAIAAAGLVPRVRWAGRPDDRTLHAWYEAADLFVHPTVYEGSSLVTLEAMAHRLAVVATRAGGLPDKVIPNRTGWLVPAADPGALGEALDEALARRSEWSRMGAAGRALAETSFAWPVVQRLLRELYADLVARARPRG